MTTPDLAEVLLIDDNVMLGEAIRSGLAYLGYSVECALDAREGWARFSDRGAQAVITDNVMEDLEGRISYTSGVELAARIKESSPNTPVIMLTGMPCPEAQQVCDVVLTKPVRMRTLADALRRFSVAGI